MSKRRCINCKCLFVPRRNIQQNYCSQIACQNMRKRLWRKQKRASDPDYQDNQRRAQQKWKEKSSEYWRGYRKNHPEYTQRNRQQTRDRKRLLSCKRNALRFAKSDALLQKNSFKSGGYILLPMQNSRFAKSDALRVKISLIS